MTNDLTTDQLMAQIHSLTDLLRSEYPDDKDYGSLILQAPLSWADEAPRCYAKMQGVDLYGTQGSGATTHAALANLRAALIHLCTVHFDRHEAGMRRLKAASALAGPDLFLELVVQAREAREARERKHATALRSESP